MNNQGQQESRYFLNVADAGLGGETVERVNRQSKLLGGKISFLWGSVRSILGYRNKQLICRVDGENVAAGEINSVMVCNGRFIGGGMMIAPNAELDDGLFDIVILGNFTKFQLIRHFPKIYQGKHITIPGVSVVRGSQVEIDTGERILLDVDGEQPGCAPASFSILPKALRIWT